MRAWSINAVLSADRLLPTSKGGREGLGIEALCERMGTLTVILQERRDIVGQPYVPELAS